MLFTSGRHKMRLMEAEVNTTNQSSAEVTGMRLVR